MNVILYNVLALPEAIALVMGHQHGNLQGCTAFTLITCISACPLLMDLTAAAQHEVRHVAAIGCLQVGT